MEVITIYKDYIHGTSGSEKLKKGVYYFSKKTDVKKLYDAGIIKDNQIKVVKKKDVNVSNGSNSTRPE